MNTWIVLTIIYALCIGVFECAKKKAVEQISIYEVLAGFSTLSFIIVACTNTDALLIDKVYIPIIILKAIIIVIAWLLSMYVINKISFSTYSITRLSQLLFTVLMSCLILGENITIKILVGMIIVIGGLVLVNKISNKEYNEKTTWTLIVMLLVSCFLNSCSEIIDKKVLEHITSTQLQFWFLLILTIIYWIIVIVKQRKINYKRIFKNYWVLIAAILVTIGDRCLFEANSNPESQVSIMTILKQISVIESILLGKLIFKEKNIIKKLLCAIIVIIGIIIIVI